MSGSVERVELAPGYSAARVVNGCWQLSAGHREAALDAGDVVDGWLRLADAGFTSFDCADIYTGVEELLGRFLGAWRARGGDPGAIQIHTKYVPDADELAGLTKARVEAIVDRSLTRLGVERLDLVQFAWWNYSVPGWVEAAFWLEELRQAGKIRHLGATNFDVPRLRDILDAGVDLVAHQVQYSLLDRRPENGMAALCGERGVQLVTYGSLGGGFLSERWLGAEESRALDNRSLVKYRLIVEEFGGWKLYQSLLRELDRIAGIRGATMASVATRWVLGRPGVGSVIVGARDDRHLEENRALGSLRLTPDDLEALNSLLAQSRGPAGDTFDLERDPEGPHSAIMWKNLNRGGAAR